MIAFATLAIGCTHNASDYESQIATVVEMLNKRLEATNAEGLDAFFTHSVDDLRARKEFNLAFKKIRKTDFDSKTQEQLETLKGQREILTNEEFQLQFDKIMEPIYAQHGISFWNGLPLHNASDTGSMNNAIQEQKVNERRLGDANESTNYVNAAIDELIAQMNRCGCSSKKLNTNRDSWIYRGIGGIYIPVLNCNCNGLPVWLRLEDCAIWNDQLKVGQLKLERFRV